MTKPHSHLRTLGNQDGAAILNGKAGTISTLNVTGAFIWEALQRGDASPAIAAQLAKETGEVLQRVESDVDAFIASLRNHSLLKPGAKSEL